ncbi:deoxycytidyl transferase [Irineochytrium annulatum]|nr:deoxycytidyl transferase [Irineochytrium annulatum]
MRGRSDAMFSRGKGSAFKDGRDYMEVKASKHQVQSAGITGELSNIFHGVVLYFDGYLGEDMTMNDFRDLVLRHGAKVLAWLTPEVTHIVGERITDRKRELWARKRVLRYEWLTDSIKNGKLLPWRDYSLIPLRTGGQTTLAYQRFDGGDAAKNMMIRVDKGGDNAGAGGWDEDAGDRNGGRAMDSVILAPASPELMEEDRPPTPTKVPRLSPPPEQPPPQKEPSNHPLGWERGTRPAESEDTEWLNRQKSTAPGFVEKYYASSRLSKISNWKADLKDYVASRCRDLGLPRRLGDSAAFANGTGSSSSPAGDNPRTILHVDMDCFFASVALRDRPHLRNLPVVVCHSSGTSKPGTSTSEIASCNYIARSRGCRNGMLLGKAQQLCPELRVVPYEFEKYDACSKSIYDVLIDEADDIMAISCDEAYVDVSSRVGSRGTVELDIAERIRARVREATGGCAASVGVGENMLVARIATKRAKPDGAFQILPSETPEYMGALPVAELPGVGYHLKAILDKFNVNTCGELAQKSLQFLKKEIGDVKGQKLYENCRGIDARPLSNKARQSVGAEVNWGVRFQSDDQVETFLRDLSTEVEGRLRKVNAKSLHLTVKCKQKLYDGAPYKVLGCGECSDHSRSRPFPRPTDSAELIYAEAVRLMREIGIPATEIRGVGIQLTKLKGPGFDDDRPELESGQTRLTFQQPAATSSRKAAGSVTFAEPAPPTKRKASDADLDLHPARPNPTGGASNSVAVAQAPAAALTDGDWLAEVDLSLLPLYPKEIQDELLEAMRRRKVGGGRSAAARRFEAVMPESHSQVDTQVLKALPRGLRREIQGQLDRAKAERVAADVSAQALVKIKGYKAEVAEVALVGRSRPEDVRAMIREWAGSTRTPEVKDATVFRDFLEEMIGRWQIRLAIGYMRELKRALEEYHYSSPWWAMYCQLKDWFELEFQRTQGARMMDEL